MSIAFSPIDGQAEATEVPKADAFEAAPLSSYFRWKGVLDRIAAFLLLIPGLPLIGVLVLLIRVTSRGPGIFSQNRVGGRGKIFTMYKLRSMRMDAESHTGPVWSIPGNDPRVTHLGYWLRKLHLDELPQLFNVLKGEMSLIGPRPERPEFVSILADVIPDYRDRLRVAPGVTGIAQINLPPDTDLNDVRRKLVLDKEYIATANMTLDCRILLCTFLRLLGIKGEWAIRMMWLSRQVQLPTGDNLSHQDDAKSALLASMMPDSIAQSEPTSESQMAPDSRMNQPLTESMASATS